MCLAIAIEKNAKLSAEYAQNGFNRNREGAGFAYVENNKVIIRKGFFNFDEFWKEFDEIQQKNNEAKLVHFRIATVGAVTKENCHPWRLNDSAALIHNGTFSGFSYESQRISDTGLFVEKVLSPIYSKYKYPLPNSGFKWMTEKDFSSQKIAILYNTPKGVGWIVYCPHLWWEVKGLTGSIWYSNTSYKSSQVFLTYPESAFETAFEKRMRKRAKKDKYRYADKGSQKRKKHHKWRLVGEIFALKPDEINRLTHLHKKKMKQLESEKIVERCWDEDIQRDLKYIDGSWGKNDSENWEEFPICGDCGKKHHICSACDFKDPSYKDFWTNKAPRMSVCRRDDIILH